MTRSPVVSGSFYEESKKELIDQIESCFTHKFGPGKITKTKSKNKILGAISPHAGYFFSGPCAAHIYKKLAESQKPDTLIIIGPNHTGMGKSSITLEDFETPLGIIKTDTDLAKKILTKTDLKEDTLAHKREHSIEVQLPFIQHTLKDTQIVPIVLSGEIDPIKLGKELNKIIEEEKKTITIIASSDMTHYGMNYGYLPFKENQKENMYQLDKKAIDIIIENNPKRFIEHIKKTQATICGLYPILTLMSAMEQKKATILKYYTSGDIINDYKNQVGYAALIFE